MASFFNANPAFGFSRQDYNRRDYANVPQNGFNRPFANQNGGQGFNQRYPRNNTQGSRQGFMPNNTQNQNAVVQPNRAQFSPFGQFSGNGNNKPGQAPSQQGFGKSPGSVHQPQNNFISNNRTPARNQTQPAKEPYTDPSVTFEPLDEKMFEAVQKSLALPHGDNRPEASVQMSPRMQPGAVPSAARELTIPEMPVYTNSENRLLEVIQNERNGAQYYAKLSAIAGEHSGFFNGVKHEYDENFRRLSDFYKILKTKDPEIEQTEIRLPGELKESLAAAVSEENKALAEICSLCGEEQSERVIKFLNNITVKKLININNMLLILYKIH